MESVYDYVALASFILSAVCLCLSIGLFFGLHIPIVWKEIQGSLVRDMNNTVLQRQMEKIRLQNRQMNQEKGKIDIFGDMASWSDDLQSEGDMPTTAFGFRSRKANAAKTTLLKSGGSGTALLRQSKTQLVIEKDLVYVSTDRCL